MPCSINIKFLLHNGIFLKKVALAKTGVTGPLPPALYNSQQTSIWKNSSKITKTKNPHGVGNLMAV